MGCSSMNFLSLSLSLIAMQCFGLDVILVQPGVDLLCTYVTINVYTYMYEHVVR